MGRYDIVLGRQVPEPVTEPSSWPDPKFEHTCQNCNSHSNRHILITHINNNTYSTRECKQSWMGFCKGPERCMSPDYQWSPIRDWAKEKEKGFKYTDTESLIKFYTYEVEPKGLELYTEEEKKKHEEYILSVFGPSRISRYVPSRSLRTQNTIRRNI